METTKKVYKKKGEADPEETKATTQSPTKPEGEGRGSRGGRGGRGVARGVDRPNYEGRQQYY